MRKVFYVVSANERQTTEWEDIIETNLIKRVYTDTLVIFHPEDGLSERIRSQCTENRISCLSIPRALGKYGPGLSDRRRYRFIADTLIGLRDHGYSVQIIALQDFLNESDRELFDALGLMYLLEFDVNQYRSDGTCVYDP